MPVYKLKLPIRATIETFVEAKTQEEAEKYLDSNFKHLQLYTVEPDYMATKIYFGEAKDIEQIDKPFDWEKTGWKSL